MVSDHTCLKEIQTHGKNSTWKGLKYSTAFRTLYNPSITIYLALVGLPEIVLQTKLLTRELSTILRNISPGYQNSQITPAGYYPHRVFPTRTWVHLGTRGSLPKFGEKQLPNQSNLELFLKRRVFY